MKSQFGEAPKQEIPWASRRRGSGVVGFLARHHGIADAHALLFQAIEQASRPDEFGCQNAQREHDGKPTRPGSSDHDDSQCEQREPDEHFNETLGLLERLDQHQSSRFTRITRARGRSIARSLVRCGSTDSVSACTPISTVKSLHSTQVMMRARTTVVLRDASTLESALRTKRLPQMESFWRECGNTGPHACASQSKVPQPACAESDGSARIRICIRCRRKLSG
jgi:hypothetical protein